MSLEFVVFCVCNSLFDEPITYTEEPYRFCVCVFLSNCVCSRNLSNEAAWAQFGLMRHRKDKHDF